jgi:hypothetical protein
VQHGASTSRCARQWLRQQLQSATGPVAPTWKLSRGYIAGGLLTLFAYGIRMEETTMNAEMHSKMLKDCFRIKRRLCAVNVAAHSGT